MPDHSTYPSFPGSAIPHVGTYRRVLPISIERMYENALDWAHLPYLHSSSFTSIECEEAGPWGWRARTTNHSGEEQLLELRLDKACRRWITRVLEGQGAGAEIWTHAFSIAERRVDIVVDFFFPDVPEALRDKVGAAYARQYEILYDEDVAMMAGRQAQLDKRFPGRRAGDTAKLSLGGRDALQLPRTVQLLERDYVIVEVAGELCAFPAVCPHQLGPLDAGALENGTVTCPWHGYVFDVRTGECVSGQPCRLNNLAAVTEVNGEVFVALL